jgi:hypothetical protein
MIRIAYVLRMPVCPGTVLALQGHVLGTECAGTCFENGKNTEKVACGTAFARGGAGWCHFSGNFWMSHCKHVQRLSPPFFPEVLSEAAQCDRHPTSRCGVQSRVAPRSTMLVRAGAFSLSTGCSTTWVLVSLVIGGPLRQRGKAGCWLFRGSWRVCEFGKTACCLWVFVAVASD